MAVQFNLDRAIQIGRALAQIPEAVWEAIDFGEPEWPFLMRIVEEKANLSAALGMAVALCDYQLGTGGAQKYWQEADGAYKNHKPIDSTNKIAQMMDDLLKRPVAARLAPTKRKRIERFLASPFMKALMDRSLVELGKSPMEVWSGLSLSMRQKPDDKTIVFAMKILDLMHKAETGSYIQFPANICIPADIRIGRVALASGLINAPPGMGIAEAMESIDQVLNREKEKILAAWAHVSEEARNLSLFRIDSLVWQVGESIFKNRRAPAVARRTIYENLVDYSCPIDVSRDVGEELCRL